MTEARLENNTRPTAKLNPAAKSFVFNTAAPVWTPPSAPTAAVASPLPKLKAEAKPFVPSCTTTAMSAGLRGTVWRWLVADASVAL